ncbi:(4Fe-4S)-binding protein [Spirochaetia bacterium]|nr:(4Fe-4S)-binding protein [Spirochaetia bacterium]
MSMQYRTLGKTGIKAGVIGLGCEGLLNKPYGEVEKIVGAALDGGMNMFDFFSPNKEARSNFGKAIKGKRDKVFIQGHIGSTDIHEQNDVSRDLDTCKKYFESYLTDMGTDYIDFGMLFFVDTPNDFKTIFEGELLSYVQDLKKKGVIRHIGAGSHNSEIAQRIVKTGVVDLIMFSVNPVFDMAPAEADIYEMLDDEKGKAHFTAKIQPARAALYRLCEEKEVGITTMKTLHAGRLLSAQLSPFGSPLTPAQCIHYALTRPAVVSTLIGCKTPEEVKDTLRYFDMRDDEKDYSGIIQNYQGDYKGNCMYCNHCQPCPSQIDVAALTKYLDLARQNEKDIAPTVTQHYKALVKHGSDCVSCGNCEKRCPFSVPIIKNMKKAAELFGL